MTLHRITLGLGSGRLESPVQGFRDDFSEWTGKVISYNYYFSSGLHPFSVLGS